MTTKQQLLFLLENYCNNNYNTIDFVSLLVKYYHMNNDGSLTKEEKDLLNELVEYALYYSPFENKDKISKIIYKTESEIIEKALETYKKLLSYYKTTSFNEV